MKSGEITIDNILWSTSYIQTNRSLSVMRKDDLSYSNTTHRMTNNGLVEGLECLEMPRVFVSIRLHLSTSLNEYIVSILRK